MEGFKKELDELIYKYRMELNISDLEVSRYKIQFILLWAIPKSKRKQFVLNQWDHIENKGWLN